MGGPRDRHSAAIGLLVIIALLTASVSAQQLPASDTEAGPKDGLGVSIANEPPSIPEATLTYHRPDATFAYSVHVVDDNGFEDIHEVALCRAPDTCFPLDDGRPADDRSGLVLGGTAPADAFGGPAEPDEAPWTIMATDALGAQGVAIVVVEVFDTASATAEEAAQAASASEESGPEEAPVRSPRAEEAPGLPTLGIVAALAALVGSLAIADRRRK